MLSGDRIGMLDSKCPHAEFEPPFKQRFSL